MNIAPEDERVPEMYEFNKRAYRGSAAALEDVLATSDYLVENRFSMADIIVGWTCHFGRSMGYNDGLKNIEAYVDRLMERPHCALPAS